ncbi:hypothetical protein ACGFU4_35745 [Streptomyces sp. NPDC048511]|uniref:DUF6197 family protein n=1 Tax=Streptomyces sp. NPDC048511 TaxID=3365562 RepID=UPI00371212EA
MPSTAGTLRRAAYILNSLGMHTGKQFAAADSDALDVAAAIYFAAENTFPAEFATDETTSLAIIGASAPAVAAIRALSGSLITEPPYTEMAPGVEVPDYVEHVSHWAATAPTFSTKPPTLSEVIGALHRAAQTADLATVPAQRTAA